MEKINNEFNELEQEQESEVKILIKNRKQDDSGYYHIKYFWYDKKESIYDDNEHLNPDMDTSIKSIGQANSITATNKPCPSDKEKIYKIIDGRDRYESLVRRGEKRIHAIIKFDLTREEELLIQYEANLIHKEHTPIHTLKLILRFEEELKLSDPYMFQGKWNRSKDKKRSIGKKDDPSFLKIDMEKRYFSSLYGLDMNFTEFIGRMIQVKPKTAQRTIRVAHAYRDGQIEEELLKKFQNKDITAYGIDELLKKRKKKLKIDLDKTEKEAIEVNKTSIAESRKPTSQLKEVVNKRIPPVIAKTNIKNKGEGESILKKKNVGDNQTEELFFFLDSVKKEEKKSLENILNPELELFTRMGLEIPICEDYCPLFATTNCPEYVNFTPCPKCKGQLIVTMKNNIITLRDPRSIVCKSSPLYKTEYNHTQED